MQTAAAMLYCPNPSCQAPNPEANRFCQNCRAPLLRQYLWAIGEGATGCKAGELLGDRYLCKGAQIFLDTKPALLSPSTAEVPARLLPYLRLMPLRIHVPQVYERSEASGQEIWFLDGAPLWAGAAEESLEGAAASVQLFPALSEVWQTASPLRQLNWLWQMANLWQPFSSERTASSFLEPELLRVEGGILRLLELRFDQTPVSLKELGRLWLSWSNSARPEIVSRLQQLSEQLIEGQLYNTELLVAQLDIAIAEVAQAQTRQAQVATLSDQGPTRQRNEDACYPSSGTVSSSPLVIVCDGIGGHQGGDVASHLAIETLEQRAKALKLESLDPVTLSVELEKAICAANDQISQRNDGEQRHDRQRMGTTLVMGLVRNCELYVAHVGDSRAYWITQWGCHLITLDDDVASREVRLGYSSYRQALQQPSSGSLVQALGMSASNLLYPTVQRFILDEDSIFLFCSDGLSDHDRVEALWDAEILPLLTGKTDLATVSQRLVEVANTLNGYDNATVGLLHCQVMDNQPTPTLAVLPASEVSSGVSSSGSAAAPIESTVLAPSTHPSALETKVLQPTQSHRPISLLLWIAVLAGLGIGLLTYLFSGTTQQAQVSPSVSSSPPDAFPEAAKDLLLTPLEVGAFVQLRRSPPTNLPVLFSSPPYSPPQSSPAEGLGPDATSIAAQPLGAVPIGSILEVLSIGGATQQGRWVRLQVCSTPTGASPEMPTLSEPISPDPGQASSEESAVSSSPNPGIQVDSPTTESPAPLDSKSPESGLSSSRLSPSPSVLLQPGQVGWIQEADFLPLIALSQGSSEQQNFCSN